MCPTMLLTLPLPLAATLLLAPGFQPAAPGDPMVVTAGNDVGWQVTSIEEAAVAFRERGELRRDPGAVIEHWTQRGALYRAHGVTAFEPYVKWMLMEPREGEWDPSFYDAELEQFTLHGLRWVPFLIAGPAYATPAWFKESDESVFAVDLATGDVSRDQSIWNPNLRPRVRAWLQRFFAHYRPEEMQAVLLGISGVFGESIYTAGGNGWTTIWDGDYPQHFGWWCGDRFAEESFRRAMADRYGTIDALNRAWGVQLEGFEALRPFVPDASHSDRARLDMTRWYMGSMTEYAEWWVATTRELAPSVPILLCTGGGADPELGADMAAQTKMVARHGAGMRITNEASDYAANFHITRHISSASRLYGTYFGYEPAGEVSTDGIVARVYNAVAAGAWEFFHYDNPPDGERGERYDRYLDLLRVREPVVEAGLFWPRTSVDLKAARNLWPLGGLVRDAVDIDYIDEGMIEDGALEGLRLLVWGAGAVTERPAADRIHRAVEGGLTLVVPRGWSARTPEGEALFPSGLVAPARPGYGQFPVASMPERSAVEPWREGEFHGPESDSLWGAGVSMCWTAGGIRIHVPLPATPCRVRLPFYVGRLAEPARFLADGVEVSVAPAGTKAELLLARPEGPEGRILTIELVAGSWVPAEAGENDDTRRLSVALRDLLIEEPIAATAKGPDPVLEVHPIGEGAVVVTSGADPQSVARAVGALVRGADRYRVAPLSAEAAADGAADGVFLAVTTADLLLYNRNNEPRSVALPSGAVEIPAHGIVSVPR